MVQKEKLNKDSKLFKFILGIIALLSVFALIVTDEKVYLIAVFLVIIMFQLEQIIEKLKGGNKWKKKKQLKKK